MNSFSNRLVRQLESNEFIQDFDCGDEDLNNFILYDAPAYRKSLLAVTYVLTSKENPDKILAFYSLANDRISLSDFESKTEFNHFRKQQHFPQEKRLKSYPAIKICRLAVDLSIKGQAIGSKLLDYIKTSLITSMRTGCRFITVDAYIEAIPFYERNGFCFLNNDDEESDYTRLLYFDLNIIA